MTKLPEDVKSSVLEFVRLDDGLKKAREGMKAARDGLKESREAIIDYMRSGEIERLGIKKGSQYLELVEKTLKVRPSSECVKAKLTELLANGITNPEQIYEEINKCGGTKQVWKLARRTKRHTGGDGEQPKKKRQKKQQQEQQAPQAADS